MKTILSQLKKFWTILQKSTPILLIVVIAITIGLFITNIIQLNKPDRLDILQQELKEKEIEVEKHLEDLKYISLESQGYRQQSISYRKQLESLKNDPNLEAENLILFYEFNERFSLFNENFAEKNEETYLSLLNYRGALFELKKEVEKKALGLSIIPYALVWKSKDKWIFGGGIDADIPINHEIAIVAGVGFFNDSPFVKLGGRIKF